MGNAGCEVWGHVTVSVCAISHRPDAHRPVARRRRVLLVVRVDRQAVHDVGVRSHQRDVLLRGDVQHPDRAGGGAHQQLEAVEGGVDRRDGALVLRLEHVTRKVERPHAQLVVGAARHREARREVDGGDRILVELVDVLEGARARVDDEEAPRRAA